MSSLRTRLAFIALVLGLLAAACGGGTAEEPSDDAGSSATETTDAAGSSGGEDTTTTEATTETAPEITLPPAPPSNYEEFAAQTTACGAEAPEPATAQTFSAPEDQELDPNSLVTVTIATSCGDIVVEMDPSLAPETVNSFVFLARQGYFDGTVSHRVIPGFVIQAGDPSATGREGPGYTIPDELPEPGFIYQTGSLAMANAGPNTTGSQFFIVLADAPLPAAYSYFGNVVDGFDTMERISQIPLGPNAFGEVSVPMETLYIEQVTIAQ